MRAGLVRDLLLATLQTLPAIMPKDNYTSLPSAIAKKSGYPTKRVNELIKLLIGEVRDRLVAGEDVALRGFGTFTVKTAKPKMGRNPKKPETQIQIPARQVVKFRPGQELRECIATSKTVD